MHVHIELLQLCPAFCNPPWTVAHQAPLSMGFSRQEYWSGLPCSSPGDLPNPGIEPGSPALQADSLLPKPRGKKHLAHGAIFKKKPINSQMLSLIANDDNYLFKGLWKTFLHRNEVLYVSIVRTGL